jgi:hypothetical protein
LFDLANGLDIGHLDLGFTLTVQFDPATGDLLTFGRLGAFPSPGLSYRTLGPADPS